MRAGAAGLVKGVLGGAKYIFDWKTTTWGYFRREICILKFVDGVCAKWCFNESFD